MTNLNWCRRMEYDSFSRASPSGLVVKFGTLGFMAGVQFLGVDLYHLSVSGHAVVATHYKKRKTGGRC